MRTFEHNSFNCCALRIICSDFSYIISNNIESYIENQIEF